MQFPGDIPLENPSGALSSTCISRDEQLDVSPLHISKVQRPCRQFSGYHKHLLLLAQLHYYRICIFFSAIFFFWLDNIYESWPQLVIDKFQFSMSTKCLHKNTSLNDAIPFYDNCTFNTPVPYYEEMRKRSS